MSEPLVSVIIPNFNYGRFLRAAIDSVLAQSYRNTEVIVVDDGSTDESIDVLRCYGSRLRVVQQANRGVSAARNRGISESAGELVAFLDADDAWYPEKLALQVRQLASSEAGLVYCGVEYVDDEGRLLGQNITGNEGWILKSMVLLQPTALGLGSTSVVRRTCLDRVGGFDEVLSTSADWDLARRLACQYKIEKLAAVLVRYRFHAANMHRRVDLMERDMLLALDKTFSDPAAASVHSLRRRSYASLYRMLSGSYLHAGESLKALLCIARGAALWPPSLCYAAGMPWRRLRRHLRGPLPGDSPGRS